ncbi:MAG: TauD/TfdA family dioxygenase, partial [Proteobacteria bacterium]|nr:TauD/TfdA family dioxygenase [Pseudomonadota bacterium]
MSQPDNQPALACTAFDPGAEDSPASVDYGVWRDEVLRNARPQLSDLLVKVEDPYQLSVQEKRAISDSCSRYNMAVYEISDPGVREKSLVHALGGQLGLVHLDSNLRADEDAVSSLQVRSQTGNQYIPYTNKALSWHTDGYYNRLDKQIFAIIMHCVRPAEQGGMNRLLDPQQVYIALREKNRAYVDALMHAEAMTIPDNVENGKVLRAAQSGPVFSVKPDGRLHMRFSARKRNIIWRDTPETRAAVAMMHELMADDENVLKVALKSGQGIICNNVLH